MISAAAVIALCLLSRPADAVELFGADLDIEIQIPDEDAADGFRTPRSDVEKRSFFNAARCECPPESGGEFQIEIELVRGSEGLEPESSPVELWVGNGCNSTLPDDLADCEFLNEFPDIRDLQLENFRIPFLTAMFPNDEEDICHVDAQSREIWMVINEGNQITEDFDGPTEFFFDTEPPPLPDEPTLRPAESGAQLDWKRIDPNVEDIDGYQILCAHADGSPGGANGDAARYEVASTLCGADPIAVSPEPGASDLPADLPAGLLALEDRFICGTATETATGFRVSGLSNNEEYDIVVVSFDEARNPSAQYMGRVIPTPAADFWEDYHGAGGGADGGFCLATSTYGDGSSLTQALRDFRDGTLAQFAIGRALIDGYYAYVAPLGVYIERYTALRVVAAVVLAPAVAFAAFWEYTGPLTKLLALWGAMWLLLARRRRRRARRQDADAVDAADTADAGPDRVGWWGRARGGLDSLVPGRVYGFRTPRWAGAVAGALALAAWASPAAAQGYNPYWTHFPEETPADLGPPKPLWNLGLKLGPYLPEIDSSLDLASGQAGPYETFFGGSSLMFAVDLDRYFLFPLGQLGVTGTVGITGASAGAFTTTDCMQANDPAPCTPGVTKAVDADGNLIRSEGDNTSFRMVPISVGAVYRFTEIDERFKVPVVPYGKLGLAYYIWWITQPDGSIAEAPTADCPDPSMGCDGDPGRGASLGVQATVGISVRAERLDHQAALNMRNELGIEHIGFYAELTWAQVDGFGADDKLSVGDLTWFGGLNFEF